MHGRCNAYVFTCVPILLWCVVADDCRDLTKSCLWSVDLSWTSEAQELREVAIQWPDKLTVAFARDKIAHLKITDKQVIIYNQSLYLTQPTCVSLSYNNALQNNYVWI